MRQLAPSLLLKTQSLDLLGMALGGGDQTLATTIEQDDRVVEVVEERRWRIVTEVREEEVEPVLVHTRCEQPAIAVPLLPHVVAEGGRVEAADRLERTGHRITAEVELACRPDLRDLELGDRLLGRRIERAQVLDIIPEPLGTPGSRTIHAEDVDDAATHREVAGDGDRALATVAELHKAREQRIAGQVRTPLDLGEPRLDDAARQRRPEQAARRGNHQERFDARVQPHEGRETGARHLFRRRHPVERRRVAGGKDGGSGPAVPDERVGVHALGLRGDDQHRPRGRLAQPPGEQADRTRRNAGDDPATSVAELGKLG